MVSVMTSVPAMLFDLIQAPLRWQVLNAGLQLDLFDRLTDGRDVAELAASLELDPRRLMVVLDALCSMELLDKQGCRYQLAASAAPYLRSDSDRSLRPMLQTLPLLRHADVLTVLRGEEAEMPPDLSDPAFWDRSAASLRSFHRGMGADLMIGLLESLPEWPSVRRVLDLGAGSETLALRIIDQRPQRTVTVLDLPPLAARIAGAVDDRVRVISGDFNETDLGGPHDLIWASMTLYFARDLTTVLRKARQALAAGGVFVSLHEGLTRQRTAPESHVIGRLVPALRGVNVSFEHGQIATALRQAGFAEVESRQVATPFGLIELDVARGEG